MAKYVVVQFLQNNLCWSKFTVFLVFISLDLVWCWWQIIKQIFPTFFCLLSKLFTLGNIIFNSDSRRILITSSELFMTLNKRVWNICLLQAMFTYKFMVKMKNICNLIALIATVQISMEFETQESLAEYTKHLNLH